MCEQTETGAAPPPFPPRKPSLIRKAVFLVFTLALPYFLGAQATFFAEPVTDLLCAILTSAVFLSNINRLLDERLAMPDDVQLYQ